MATPRPVTLNPGAQQPTQGGVALPPRTAPFDTSQVDPTIGGSIDSVRAEINDAFADMALCHNSEPDQAMRYCSGHSARLSFLRVLIQRVEDYKREWRNVRVREIEPAIEELANQYTIASRLHSVRELDWKMESGER